MRGASFSLNTCESLETKKPLFFLAENVSGMLHKRNSEAVSTIISQFSKAGYVVNHKLLNARDYGVPQDRQRVIYVGYRKDLGMKFEFPAPHKKAGTLRDAIGDLAKTALPAGDFNRTRGDVLVVPNHEYMHGGFSTIYMSRNRVRAWDEPSFTIQAGGRHAPIHPQAPKMVKVGQDEMKFVKDAEHLYRRLTVRECARVQTFPDNFIFRYETIADGYKMVGNAVPVKFATMLALQIYADLRGHMRHLKTHVTLTKKKSGVVASDSQAPVKVAA